VNNISGTLKHYTRESSSTPAFIISVLLYKTVLDISYVVYISEYLSISGDFYALDVNWLKIVESFLLLAIVCGLIERRKNPSSWILLGGLVTLLVPSLSLYGLMSGDRTFTIVYCIAFILVITISRYTKTLRIPKIRYGNKLTIMLSWVTVLGSFLILFVNVGVLAVGESMFNPRFYFFRDIVKERFFSDSWIAAYPVSFSLFVCQGFLIVDVIHNNRRWLYSVVVLVPLMLAWMTTQKKALLLGLLFVFLYYLAERHESFTKLLNYWTLFVAGLLSAAMVLPKKLPYTIPFSQIFDRLLYTPARLNYAYNHFFSENEYVLLSSTHIPVPFDYPYREIPTKLVSSRVFYTDSVASAGWIASSFMHFGHLGVVIYAILIGLLLVLVNSAVNQRIDAAVGVAVSTPPIFNMFLQKSFTSSMFSGGVGLLIILLIVYRTDKS
jgi:hypothetical protein